MLAIDTVAGNQRERIDLRVDPEIRARIEAAAKRLGLPLSAFLRVAAIEKCDRDEEARPRPRKRK